jgi:hypothetical protein
MRGEFLARKFRGNRAFEVKIQRKGERDVKLSWK